MITDNKETPLRIAIENNYLRILEQIEKSASKAGRKPDGIHLVVVTKTHPVEVIRAVIEAGAKHLGENYVEDALEKIENLRIYPGINWHMVGHVQSRKYKAVCDNFNYLHSLDRLILAEKISSYMALKNNKLPVFLEFNMAGEETKSGWNISVEDNWESILPDIEKISALQGLNVLGAMAIPPYADDPENSRPYFQKLREFQDFTIDKLHLTGFRDLSMGMSNDYKVAIEEGATWVRIGQAILGARQ
jgi:PLP dependent protein